MTIEEIIDLYNRSSDVYEETCGNACTFAIKNKPVDEILENRRIAVANLQDKSREELVQFIMSRHFNDELYPVLR